MNRSIFRIPKSLLSATLFAAALLLSSRTAVAAPVVISGTKFSITYQDGWASVIPMKDSTYFLMNATLNGAFVNGVGVQMGNGITAATYARIFTSGFTAQFALIDSSNKTFGANSFICNTYRDSSTGGDAKSRIRVYVTTKGSYAFISWLAYSLPDEASVVAQQEAALATLNITAISGIRIAPVGMASALPREAFDVQGRSLLPEGNAAGTPAGKRMPNVAVFRKP